MLFLSSFTSWDSVLWRTLPFLAPIPPHPALPVTTFSGCGWPRPRCSCWEWEACYCSVSQSCPTLSTPWTAACQASLTFAVFWSLRKLMSIESAMLFNRLLFAPSSSCPQSFSASGSFSVSWLFIWWPKYWRFSFSISPSSQHSGLISFRTDWFDLLPVQGRLLKCT